jgi:lysozyme family protein
VSADFDRAIPVILGHEGGAFVDHPADPGGATKWGITLSTLRRSRPSATAADVAALTSSEASAIYRREWWDALGYAAIGSQIVATKIFDMAVNMGPRRAHRLAQRAFNSLGLAQIAAGGAAPQIPEDGLLGPVTFAALNEADAGGLLAALAAQQSAFYRELAARKPEMAVFLRGWLKRARWPFLADPAALKAGVTP